MVSTPRLVGIKGRVGGVNTGSGPLTQSYLDPAITAIPRDTLKCTAFGRP
jgi:hypothetical protein